MADALFDTTVLIDYRRGDPAAQSLVKPVLDGRSTASFSPITVAELWQGKMKDRKEELEYTAILSVMEEAPLRSDEARRAGDKIRGYGYNQKANLFADALIAATAEERDEPLYTRNDRDMSRFYSNVKKY